MRLQSQVIQSALDAAVTYAVTRVRAPRPRPIIGLGESGPTRVPMMYLSRFPSAAALVFDPRSSHVAKQQRMIPMRRNALEIVKASIGEAPTPHGKFDVLVSPFALQASSAKIREHFSAIHRLLSPEGVFQVFSWGPVEYLADVKEILALQQDSDKSAGSQLPEITAHYGTRLVNEIDLPVRLIQSVEEISDRLSLERRQDFLQKFRGQGSIQVVTTLRVSEYVLHSSGEIYGGPPSTPNG